MKVTLTVFACFFAVAESGRSGSYSVGAPSAVLAVAPSAAAPASAPSAAKPSLKAEDIRFNLENFNFFDLQRKLDYTRDASKSAVKKDKKNLTSEVPKLTVNLEKENATASNETKTKESLLLEEVANSEVDNCRLKRDDKASCILDLLQDIIESTIKNLIDTALAALPSAPAAAVAAASGPAAMASVAPAVALASAVEAKPAATLLQQRKRDAPAPAGSAPPQGLMPDGSAPSPAPAPSAPPVGVTVFTSFKPGKTRELASKKSGSGSKKVELSLASATGGEGRVTVVDSVVYGNPGSGIDELSLVDSILANFNEEGLLVPALTEAVFEASGIKPHITNIDTKPIKIKQWSIDKCSAHMADAVGKMTQAYTRRQVPVALFNECTNFMPQVSFSQDTMIDELDTHRCRLATADFAKRWSSGADDSVNYRAFCLDVCEYKYGHSRPLCHITSGDKLLNKAP